MAISEVADDPEEFRASFEETFAELVQQHRTAREEARRRAQERIHVYLLDGNDIRLRQKGDIWIAEHCDLDVFTQGASVAEALSDLRSSSIEYVASLWERGRDALAKNLVPHYDFIESFGGRRKWEEGFRKAVKAKLSELAQDERQEHEKPKQVPPSFFEELLNAFTPPVPSFATQALDLDRLRKEYNENLIKLVLTQMHVTIKSDADGIILRFIGDTDLNGLPVLIYKLDNGAKEREERLSITRIIKGNEVSFTLSGLGLTIRELNRIVFKLNIGNQKVEGRL